MGRIPALDVLRGFALLGIVLGNVMWFSGFAVAGPDARAHMATPGLDAVAEALVHVFVDGKFYSVFALLFGAGFVLSRRSDPRRRLVALLVIGLAHAVFLWFGDIVSLYAVVGVGLLFVRQWSARRLARAGVACLVVPPVLSGAWLAAHAMWGVSEGAGYGPGALLPAFASGSYADVLASNGAFLVDRWYLAIVTSRLLRVLGMFLLGAAAARWRIWERRDALLGVVGTLWPFALVANVALGVLGGAAPPRPPTLVGWLTDILYSVGAPTAGLVYAALVVLGARWLGVFAAAGRLSLTNYIMQSLVMALLFYGYGLGLWGRVGAAGAIGIAVAVFIGQALLSRAWLRKFSRGPMEWVLTAAQQKRPRLRGPT